MSSYLASLKATASQAIYGTNSQTDQNVADANAKATAAGNTATDHAQDLTNRAIAATHETAKQTGDAIEAYAGVADTKKNETQAQASTAFDQLHNDMRNKTNEAIAEGQKDVNNAQAQGQTYLEQAKSLTSDAISAAQGYVTAGERQVAPNTTTGPTSSTETAGTGPTNSISATLSQVGAATLSTTNSLLESAKGALAPADPSAAADARRTADRKVEEGKQSAQQTAADIHSKAQSFADASKETAAPYVDDAARKVKPHLESAHESAQQTLSDTQKRAQQHIDGTQPKNDDTELPTAPTSFGTGLY